MNVQEDKTMVIEAAGGVVWRDGPGGRELALIHRPRYNDWSLPKGHLEPGESWVAAALREVEEETGCQVQLGEFAGTTNYLVKGTPKIVLFWHMELVQLPPYQANEETDELVWLKADEAWRRLTYAAERMLLNGFLPPRDRHIAAATAYIRNPTGHILLINSTTRGWELPGGIIEAGEDLHQGAEREVWEETGIRARIHTLAFVNSSISPPSKFIFGCMGDYMEGMPTPSPESTEVVWVTPDEAQHRITNPIVLDRLERFMSYRGRVTHTTYHPYPFQIVRQEVSSQ